MYVVKIKDLLQEPTQLQAFAAHVATFKKIQVEGKEMGDRVRKTETMQRLLSEFDVKIAPSEQVAFGELKEAVARFEDQLITTEQKIHKSMVCHTLIHHFNSSYSFVCNSWQCKVRCMKTSVN
jgi:hypothetical protein